MDSVGLLMDRFTGLREQVEISYGVRSQARMFVLYEELVLLRAVLSTDGRETRLSTRIAELRAEISHMYLVSGADIPPVNRKILRLSPLLLEFDRSVFERRYRSVCDQVVQNTFAVRDPITAAQRFIPGKSYMFVVDDEGELLVWNRPFEFMDLLFGRNRATVDGIPVAHPMMVPERLRVRAAGEIIFIGSERASMVVANTKSGHFQPPQESVRVVLETCRRVLGVGDDDIDVFNFFPPAARGESTEAARR